MAPKGAIRFTIPQPRKRQVPRVRLTPRHQIYLELSTPRCFILIKNAHLGKAGCETNRVSLGAPCCSLSHDVSGTDCCRKLEKDLLWLTQDSFRLKFLRAFMSATFVFCSFEDLFCLVPILFCAAIFLAPKRIELVSTSLHGRVCEGDSRTN